MKRAFLYELKRNLLPLGFFAAMAVVLCGIFPLIVDIERGNYTYNSCLGMPTFVLALLCTVLPIMQFSYRMQTRSVDLWYSLPISRKQFTLVRLLVGLIVVFVAYTLGYWLCVAIVAARAVNPEFIWYLPMYAVSLVAAIGLFGVNSFLFTRANRVLDGILFLVGWTCILPLVVYYFGQCIVISGIGSRGEAISLWELNSFTFSYSAIVSSSTFFDHLIRGDEFFTTLPAGFTLALIIGVLEAVAGYILLFIYADRDKAEHADQISSSRWGYKTLIPAYTVMMLANGELFFSYLFGTTWIVFIYYVVIVLAAFVLYFVYRHSFRLKKSDLISLGLAVVVGAVLAFAMHAYVNWFGYLL